MNNICIILNVLIFLHHILTSNLVQLVERRKIRHSEVEYEHLGVSMLSLINARSFQIAKVSPRSQEPEGPVVTCVSPYPTTPRLLRKIISSAP